MPAISVVLPVYNAAPFLREALDSLLAQTCGDFEAIAVNDGSTDNSLEILQEYAGRDSRIRILDGPNGGYGKAMNRGMDAAIGKYMAILEPDDYLPREAYAILLEMAEKNRLDVARGSYCTFFEAQGKRQYTYYAPLAPAGVIICPRNEPDTLLRNPATTWSSLYRLAFVRDNGIRYHESPGASYQDTGMYMLSAVYANRYMLTPEPVYMYRVDNPNSSINTADKKSGAIMAEHDYIGECIRRTPQVWAMVQPAYWRCATASWEWMLGLLSAGAREAYMEKLCERVQPLVERRLLPEYELRKYESMLSLPTLQQKVEFLMTADEPSVVGKCIRWAGLPLYSAKMCAEETERRVLNIPFWRRQRIRRWQPMSSGVIAASGLMDVYYLMGIPVARRWVVRCGGPLPRGSAPAKVTDERSSDKKRSL